jgi:cytochrome c peroxidase
MKGFALFSRFALGFVFLVFGVDYFFSFLPELPVSQRGLPFLEALSASGYFFPLLKTVEISSAALLLLGLFVPLAIVLLAPVVLNIFFYHLFLDRGGLPLAALLFSLELFLAFAYRETFRSLFPIHFHEFPLSILLGGRGRRAHAARPFPTNDAESGTIRNVSVVIILLLGTAFVMSSSPATGQDTAAYAAVSLGCGATKAGTLDDLAFMVRYVARRGARYIALPAVIDEQRPETVPGTTTNYFAGLARKWHLWLAFSVPESAGNGEHYITAVLVNPDGSIVARHRKVMLGLHQSREHLRRGDYREVTESVDDDGLRLGVVAGDDMLSGVPRLADRGAETILVTAAWPKTTYESWDRLGRYLSKQYSVNLVIANLAERTGGASSCAAGGVYSRGDLVARSQPVAAGGVAIGSIEKLQRNWQVSAPLGLPSVPFPPYQQPQAELAELGRQLFLDKNLSSTGEIACASCHQPERAFTNGKTKGTGVDGRTTKRNVPSLLNVAFRPLLQWDGYASSLENFVKYPLSGYTEMNFHYLDEAVAYVRSRPDYEQKFQRVMGVSLIGYEDIAHALATYLRTLVSGNSAFDRFYYGHDPSALEGGAKAGLMLFAGKAGCSACHQIGDHYALFTDFKYHDLGVGSGSDKATYDDVGLGAISTGNLSGLFLTPSLRDVGRTAPYMHDGSFRTLEEVVEYLNRGGNPSPHHDPAIKALHLSQQEKQDLVAFLRSLTGDRSYAADGLPQSGTVAETPDKKALNQEASR